ncbi:hypothetical protein KIPB_004260, partial [Kipferlia bialata]
RRSHAPQVVSMPVTFTPSQIAHKMSNVYQVPPDRVMLVTTGTQSLFTTGTVGDIAVDGTLSLRVCLRAAQSTLWKTTVMELLRESYHTTDDVNPILPPLPAPFSDTAPFWLNEDMTEKGKEGEKEGERETPGQDGPRAYGADIAERLMFGQVQPGQNHRDRRQMVHVPSQDNRAKAMAKVMAKASSADRDRGRRHRLKNMTREELRASVKDDVPRYIRRLREREARGISFRLTREQRQPAHPGQRPQTRHSLEVVQTRPGNMVQVSSSSTSQVAGG